LDYGITYAHAARKSFQDQVDQQTTLTMGLSSGLIGLGGVLAALATFGAHRDAIVGGSLLGGTAYALGNWNLNKQRQLIYLAGVEGVNCSLRAVGPLYLKDTELNDLVSTLGEVEAIAPSVASAISNVMYQAGQLPETDEQRKAAERLAWISTRRNSPNT
jgi:hypothetical protein